MYAVMGITGQVGGAVARALLKDGRPVRAVVRDAAKGGVWAEKGCDVAIADIEDVEALTGAFLGMEGVFILLPPMFDPAPGFPEVRTRLAAIREALVVARPGKIVCLSTIGAAAPQYNILNQLGLMEEAFSGLPVPVAFLRAAWFMENAAWDVASAREEGVVPSFLQPLDKPFPMIATEDVGRAGACLLQEGWTGVRIVEAEGPVRVRPLDIAESFTKILGKPVRAEAVARSTWKGLFESQGMKNPDARIAMLDGFNEGWIEFAAGEAGSYKGKTGFDEVARKLVGRAA